MIACHMESKTLHMSESTTLTASYAVSDNVKKIKAFVLAADTLVPLRGIWLGIAE